MRWLEFPGGLQAPFFREDRKESEAQSRGEVTEAPLPCLIQLQDRQLPKGFIFHGSRSGSTLLSRFFTLSEEITVLSEPTAFGRLAALSTEFGSPLSFRAMMRALGVLNPGTRSVVCKLNSATALHISELLRSFPEIPWVFVSRHPAEILDSNLRKTGGWLRNGKAEGASPDVLTARVMTALTNIYRAVLEVLPRSGLVVPYEKLCHGEGFEQAAEHFDLQLSAENVARGRRALNFHAHTGKPFDPRAIPVECYETVERRYSRVRELYHEIEFYGRRQARSVHKAVNPEVMKQ
ncbi:MAG: hypothetical protein AB7S38_15560 [Vulcanimicrobiota bacterium]